MIFNKKSVVDGLIIPVFKPLNWSSFDVVKKLRNDFKKTFKIKKIKVGHAGTLDPLATGLLLMYFTPAGASLGKNLGFSKGMMIA